MLFTLVLLVISLSVSLVGWLSRNWYRFVCFDVVALRHFLTGRSGRSGRAVRVSIFSSNDLASIESKSVIVIDLGLTGGSSALFSDIIIFVRIYFFQVT